MIYALFEHLNKGFEIIKILPQKPTARCPFSAVVSVDGEKKLVVIANTDIQKFYLKRSIEKQREFYDDFSPCFQFNFPDAFGDLNDFSYAIYPYLENVKWCKDERPIEFLNEIYSKNAKTYKMTPALLTKIQKDFLDVWPEQFHQEIKELALFKKYFETIAQEKEVRIYKEHGDYTVNNILDDGKNLWLVDFEFAKSFQVIGCDLHDFGLSFNKNAKQHKNINALKIDLINAVNNLIDIKTKPKIELVDSNKSIEKVYPNFTYNRFDIRFNDDFKMYAVHENEKTFFIPYHIENDLCIVGVWLTPISKRAFDLIIDDIFDKNHNVFKIYARYSLNQYDGLDTFNHWRVELPENIEEFATKLSARTRYNTSWYPKKIKENFGDYEIKIFRRAEISDDIVNRYFEFKKLTHGYDYHMTPTEYLDNFYVTHAYVMYISGNIEAIIFNCLVNDIAYIENLSFNSELHKYSLGTVLYYYLINDLIKNTYIWVTGLRNIKNDLMV